MAANATHMNAEDRTKLLGLLKDIEDFFDVNIGDWYTEPIDIAINPNSKSFNCKYYSVPRINKENFYKELEISVEIGLLTKVQQFRYSTPVLIIPKK